MREQEEFGIMVFSFIIAMTCFTVGFHLGKKMDHAAICTIQEEEI
jgi:hypothetical protein